MHEILNDTNERKSFKLHLEWVKWSLLHAALHSTDACTMMTQDLTDLLDALNVTERNPKYFGIVSYLYYQAYYPKLSGDFELVINNLENKNYNAAGYEYASILDDLVHSVREDGFAYLALVGVENGRAIELDLHNPDDSLQCFENKTAARILEFIYKLSVAVTKGKVREAPLSTLNFWNDEGAAILKEIDESVMTCLHESNDIQELNQKLGVDIDSKLFYELAKKYIVNHPVSYYGYLKAIKENIESANYIHVGDAYAKFLKDIAKKYA